MDERFIMPHHNFVRPSRLTASRLYCFSNHARQSNGTMTTPAANASAMNPSDLYRNNSSKTSGQASSGATARGTGPVDLDETQLSIDSTILDTNNTNNHDAAAASSSDGVEMSSHSHEQNAQYQKVGQPKRSAQASATGRRASNSSTSGGGLPTSGGACAPGSPDDVNLFMQNLLEDMVSDVCFYYVTWISIMRSPSFHNRYSLHNIHINHLPTK